MAIMWTPSVMLLLECFWYQRIDSVYSNVSSTKESMDAAICELSRWLLRGRLTGILEEQILLDSAGTLVAGQSIGSFTSKGSAVSKTALWSRSRSSRMTFPRKRAGHSGIALRHFDRWPVQSTGSFSADGGAVSKTAYVVEGAYTFEMTSTYRTE
jgi:hypothetical protein